jgi:hypothetical protein
MRIKFLVISGIVLAGIGVVFSLTLLASSRQSTSSVLSTPTVKQLLTSPNCQDLCWMGIEPEVTTQTEVQKIFAEAAVEYTVIREDFTNEEANAIYWLQPQDTWIWQQNSTNLERISVRFFDGIVSQVKLPLEIPLTEFVSAFGAPNRVDYWNGGGLNLIYFDLSLNALASKAGVDEIWLNADWFTQRIYEVEPDAPGLQILNDCSIVGNPCPIPTATPSQLSSPDAKASGYREREAH